MENLINNLSDKEITFALYGLLLGDGWYLKGRVRIEHTSKQEFYCKWLESVFKNNNIPVSSRYGFIRKTTFGEKEYSYISIKVPDKHEFENTKFFENNKKTISNYVLDNISVFGILLWYLDDGSLHVSTKNNRTKRFAYLNSQSFSFEENLKIANMFKTRFDIDLRIHKDRSGFESIKDKVYFRLYFNAENFRKFFDLVKPYLSYIPCQFYYKFDMKYHPNRLGNSLYLSENYNLPC